jgi:hypothetical protein
VSLAISEAASAGVKEVVDEFPGDSIPVWNSKDPAMIATAAPAAATSGRSSRFGDGSGRPVSRSRVPSGSMSEINDWAPHPVPEGRTPFLALHRRQAPDRSELSDLA